ncbi:MAG: type II toxin-antitoxin system Phd/YefM family antitoxin [Opitutales bacterium]|nr:type II toxin-antitoxin system Phd/YefM family antitoxin [Opitutales bacterium]
MSIHPQIIEKEGKKEFVVIPYEEFVAMQDSLEDYEDLKALREAKAESSEYTPVPLSSIKEDLLKD